MPDEMAPTPEQGQAPTAQPAGQPPASGSATQAQAAAFPPVSAPAEGIIKTFLSTVPGILTAVGATLAAITALVTALNQASWLRPARTPQPTAAVVAAAPSPAALSAALSAAPPTAPPPTLIGSPSAPTSAAPSPSQPTAEPATATSTAGATAAPTPAPALLLEDFSDPKTGWDIRAEDDYELGYVNGQYFVKVKAPEITVWANTPGKGAFADLIVEVDLAQLSGKGGYMGLTVREESDELFYMFGLSTEDGAFWVQKSVPGAWEDLIPWSTSTAIRKGGAVNHLKVECIGAQMRYYANDKLLIEFRDEALKAGLLGLGAGTYEGGQIEARFDNLKAQVVQRF